MTVETRLLTLHDAALVSRVAPEVFDGPVRPEWSRAFLEDPRHHLIVAIDADQVVGFVSAVDYVHPDKAPELWINEMGVAPPYRRRGIGRRLLRAMLDHARAIGCVEAWLATEEDNVAARNLYESLGGDDERQLLYTFALATQTSGPNSDMSREDNSLTVRSFAPEEWRIYRDLRLLALSESPDAFGSTHAYEAKRSDSEWAERLARGVHSSWDLPLVAEVNAEPCGLAWVRIDEKAPALAYLFQMWVAPTQRRHGTGRALLDAAIAWARVAGAHTLVLDVTIGNGEAVRLYERVGFVQVGEQKPLRPGSLLRSQAMQLSLGSTSGERPA